MEDKADFNPEEEVVTGEWMTPKVDLKEVEVKTGEEDETIFWSGRSKLYRWSEGQWKERGLGESKLLLHKKKGNIRFLLRQEKTFKIVANHYIFPTESYCKLVPNAGSEKIFAWTVKDFAEEPRIEQFALKFNTPEEAKKFKEKFEEAGEINKKLMNMTGELKSNEDKKINESEKKEDTKGKEEEKQKEDKKGIVSSKEKEENDKNDKTKGTNDENENKKLTHVEEGNIRNENSQKETNMSEKKE